MKKKIKKIKMKKFKFIKKTEDEIFKEIDKEMKDIFGDFSNASVLGEWRNTLVNRVNSSWEALEKLHDSIKENKNVIKKNK